MSQQHEKICLFCQYFYIDNSSPGYSEMTPGDNMHMGCRKDHWYFDPDDTTENQYRDMMAMARTCPDLVFVELSLQ